jgi:hypothetical protein
MLGLSTDSFHTPYVPLERIRHAIKAARRLQIRRIEVQVTGIDEGEVSQVRKELGDVALGVPIRFQKMWPIGQARQFERQSEDGQKGIDELDLTCPMGPPTLTSSRRVIGCCSSLLQLGHQNPILLGDLSRGTLEDILRDRHQNEYYLFLKHFGLRPLIEHLERRGLISSKQLKATDVCHLCYMLHSQEGIRKELVNAVVDRQR